MKINGFLLHVNATEWVKNHPNFEFLMNWRCELCSYDEVKCDIGMKKITIITIIIITTITTIIWRVYR